MNVELAPITNDNLKELFDLQVAPGQQHLVAANPWSLAQALVEHDVAWPRAVVADGAVVGFLMLEIDPTDEDGRPYWLWRLMIGEASQRMGYGAAAVRLAVEHLRSLDATELFTSWVPGDDGPAEFYLRLGFQLTGEVDEDEVVARLAIA